MTNLPKKPQDFNISKKKQQEAMILVKQGDEIVSRLSPEESPTRNSYPEAEFRKNFLPIVTGEAYKNLPEGYTSDRLHEEATRYWMMIAGGPGHEVQIVEADGTTAFIVPSLMDTSIIDTHQEAGKPALRHLAKEYQDKRIGLPHVAENMLDAGLSRKLTKLFKPDTSQENPSSKKLDGIFEYYGLKPKVEENVKEEKSSANDYMGEMEF